MQTSDKNKTTTDTKEVDTNSPTSIRTRIVVAISGASGMPYAIRLLEVLQGLSLETHLIISKAAIQTLAVETSHSLSMVKDLADHIHDNRDVGAGIASGSFRTNGMIIAPCSVKTLAEVSNGITGNLISRAADVTLKERRPLVLGVRETPFHLGHLKNMVSVTEMGAIVAPPLPAFYIQPKNINDIVTHQVGRWLDCLGISTECATRWKDSN